MGFFVKLTILTGIAAGIYAFLVFRIALPRASYDIAVFVFLYGITLLAYAALQRAGNLKPHSFVQVLMLSFVVKILLAGAFCFFMISTDYERVEANIWLFFVLYLPYTLLEIASLYRTISAKEKA